MRGILGGMSRFARAAAAFNKVAVPMLRLPLIGPLLRRGIVVIAYTGRKSGQQFELPVFYRRRGDEVRIDVAMPDQKRWWQNFTGDGAPIVVRLPDGERRGHAVTRRNESGAVSVTVALDPVAP